MAADAARLAEEQQGTLFLRDCHGAEVTSRKSIDGGVCEDQREFEFRDCPPEHGEVDRAARGHGWKQLTEERSECLALVQATQHRPAGRFIAKTGVIRRGDDTAPAIVENIES